MAKHCYLILRCITFLPNHSDMEIFDLFRNDSLQHDTSGNSREYHLQMEINSEHFMKWLRM